MRDKAAHAYRALCRAPVVGEVQRRKGTRIAEHYATPNPFGTGRASPSKTIRDVDVLPRRFRRQVSKRTLEFLFRSK
jgi:hypothetical protein